MGLEQNTGGLQNLKYEQQEKENNKGKKCVEINVDKSQKGKNLNRILKEFIKCSNDFHNDDDCDK